MNVNNLTQKAGDFTGNVWQLSNGETVLIDAGTGDSWETIRQLETVDKVVITHSHYDYVDNLPKIVDRWNPEVYGFEPSNLPVEAEKLGEGDEIVLGDVRFRVIHTPGHRDDSICLYSEEEKILFTGDLVFPDGGFGRTDLEDADYSSGESARSSNPKECCEGDRDLLIESIEKIVDLDVDGMYCGHDPATNKNVDQQLEKSLEEARKREPKY